MRTVTLALSVMLTGTSALADSIAPGDVIRLSGEVMACDIDTFRTSVRIATDREALRGLFQDRTRQGRCQVLEPTTTLMVDTISPSEGWTRVRTHGQYRDWYVATGMLRLRGAHAARN